MPKKKQRQPRRAKGVSVASSTGAFNALKSAGINTGGFIGFVLAGPLGGVFLAAITNYAVKKDTDTGEALRLVLTLYFKLQILFLKL